MYQTRSKLRSKDDFRNAFLEIEKKAVDLHNKIVDNFEMRDIAVLADLFQQEADLFQELGERTDLYGFQNDVIVRADGTGVKFKKIDGVADFLVGMNYD